MAESEDVTKYRTPEVVRTAYTEIGDSGLSRAGGIINEEFLTELKGKQGIKVLTEIGENDPIAGAVEFSIVMLMRQAKWKVVAGLPPNSQDQPSVSAAKKAAFVESCMQDMSHTWGDFISEAMSMFRYGWAWHEICYKKRQGFKMDGTGSRFDDGLIGWRKLPLRAQNSLKRFGFDDSGGIVSFTQQPPSGSNKRGELTMGVQKSLLFRTQSNKNNPMGRSGFRNAYRPWYFKKRIEEIEGIGIERDLAGLPVLTTPEGLDIWNPNDTVAATQKTLAEQLVRSIRRDEQEGILKPFGWELELLSTGGTRQFNTTEIIGRYNNSIAMTALADFIILGHNNRYGSKALAGNKTQMFQMAIVGWLDVLKDVMNRYAIPRLFILNGWPIDDELARLEHDGVEIPDIEVLGTFLNNLKQAGFTMFPNIILEQSLLQKAGLPTQGVKLGVDGMALQAELDAKVAAAAPKPVAGPGGPGGKPKVKPAAKSSPEFDEEEGDDE